MPCFGCHKVGYFWIRLVRLALLAIEMYSAYCLRAGSLSGFETIALIANGCTGFVTLRAPGLIRGLRCRVHGGGDHGRMFGLLGLEIFVTRSLDVRLLPLR